MGLDRQTWRVQRPTESLGQPDQHLGTRSPSWQTVWTPGFPPCCVTFEDKLQRSHSQPAPPSLSQPSPHPPQWTRVTYEILQSVQRPLLPCPQRRQWCIDQVPMSRAAGLGLGGHHPQSQPLTQEPLNPFELEGADSPPDRAPHIKDEDTEARVPCRGDGDSRGTRSGPCPFSSHHLPATH